MGLNDFTVYDFICRNAKIYADNESIVDNHNRLTHRQFKEKCDQAAAGLIEAGVTTGDRLAVIAHNCAEFMILYGAAAKMGAIILPVNWRMQLEEIEYVLNDCTPGIVFAGTDYHETAKTLLMKCSFIEKCYSIGGADADDEFTPFSELYSEAGAAREFDISADSGFVIIHTAAVAGEARGALLSQGNVVAANFANMVHSGLNQNDCHICIVPLFHVAGLFLSMATMHAGGKNVLVERFDPVLSLKLMEQERGTTFIHFAPILSMLLETCKQKNFDLSSIKYFLGMDSPDNIMAFCEYAPNAQVGTAFAQTEAMGVTSGLAKDRPGSSGRPTIISNVRLFDDYDREVPVGAQGEICVRSPAVFLGYWGQDEDNAYTFRNGWHHTGDIGRFDEDGFLWYVKRKAEKELIKPGGENVYPAEVEKIILEYEAVAEVSVIGVPDEQWSEAIKAIVVPKEGNSIDSDELKEFVASRIARHKKPKYVDVVDSLPKTEDDEIDRDQVKKDHGGKY